MTGDELKARCVELAASGDGQAQATLKLFGHYERVCLALDERNKELEGAKAGWNRALGRESVVRERAAKVAKFVTMVDSNLVGPVPSNTSVSLAFGNTCGELTLGDLRALVTAALPAMERVEPVAPAVTNDTWIEHLRKYGDKTPGKEPATVAGHIPPDPPVSYIDETWVEITGSAAPPEAGSPVLDKARERHAQAVLCPAPTLTNPAVRVDVPGTYESDKSKPAGSYDKGSGV
jgi:hypothetical protein